MKRLVKTLPPMDVDEEVVIPLRFARVMKDGDSIVSAVVTCEAYNGQDIEAQNSLSGPLQIAGTDVLQPFAARKGGVTYLIRGTARIEPGGRVQVAAAYLPVSRLGKELEE